MFLSATDAQLYRSGICETLLDRRRTSATRSPQTQRPPSPLDNFAVSQRRERGGVNTTLKVHVLNVLLPPAGKPRQFKLKATHRRILSQRYRAAQRRVGLECTVCLGGRMTALYPRVSSRRQANLASTSPRQRIFALFSAFSACQRRALFALSIDVPRAGCALTLPSMSSASRERRAAARTLDAIHRRPASGTRVRVQAAGRLTPPPNTSSIGFTIALKSMLPAVDAAPRSGANLCLCTSPSAERRLSQVLTIQVLVRRPTMVYIGERGILPIVFPRAGNNEGSLQLLRRRIHDVPTPTITIQIVFPRAGLVSDSFDPRHR
ncbi:hypothetical protein R3P38DRAFT_3342646 [Favolaschia claudopus]|uniref:Uncharacterized protein n=1 Tax=Favolaschia claudopus TaxID=2862362 RepID=A0AAW0DVS2_9AGAR